MAEQSAFVSKVIDLMTPLGDVRAKPMFGGYGLFLDGTMFALVPKSEELFLKADDVNKGEFEKQGAKSRGRMPYYSAPEGALESWAAMEPWATGAVGAAKRTNDKKPTKKK